MRTVVGIHPAISTFVVAAWRGAVKSPQRGARDQRRRLKFLPGKEILREKDGALRRPGKEENPRLWLACSVSDPPPGLDSHAKAWRGLRGQRGSFGITEGSNGWYRSNIVRPFVISRSGPVSEIPSVAWGGFYPPPRRSGNVEPIGGVLPGPGGAGTRARSLPALGRIVSPIRESTY